MTTEIEYYRLKRLRYVPIKSESVQPGDLSQNLEFGIVAICDADNSMSTIAVGSGKRLRGKLFESANDTEGKEFIMPDDTRMLHLFKEQYAHLYSGKGRKERAITVYHERDEDKEIETEPLLGDLSRV